MSTNDSKNRIAILITCFNRKKVTLACLNHLEEQVLPKNVEYDVFLVDDGSTDGTSEAITEQYSYVKVAKGSGNLFWNQGMRLAWNIAIEHFDYDYYLLLNDDTHLYASALKILLSSEQQLKYDTGITGIIVGSAMDPINETLTYGGVSRVKNYIGFRFDLVSPGDELVACDTFNANCVLIGRDVVTKVGVLDKNFIHGGGDYDYGLRAMEQGFQCWVAPGYIGTCARNEGVIASFDPELPLNERKKHLVSAKGMPPEQWLYFVRRHAGIWVCALIAVQLKMRLYMPRVWSLLRQLRGRQ